MSLFQEARYAARSLLRQPVLAAGALVTLALGIGATTSIFSVVNATLLTPPAGVGDPDGLVALYTSDFSGPAYGASSYPDYFDLREQAAALDGLAAYETVTTTVGEGAVTVTPALAVSANYFDVLRVSMTAGRGFAPSEDAAPGDVVVLGHALASRLFGNATAAVGRSVAVNGRAMDVVGVAPAGFVGFARSAPAELFLPTRTAQRLGLPMSSLENRGSRGVALVGRMAEGVTLEQVRTAMGVQASRLHATDPAAWTDVRGEVRRLTVVPEREARIPPPSRGEALSMAVLLMAAVGLLLLICCANVAGLLLARMAGRSREIAIRVSLGARRWRLVRQLLVESLLLAAAGGTAGVLLSVWLTDLVARALSRSGALGIGFAVTVNPRVLLFSAAVILITGLLFGLTPALRAWSTSVMSSLKRDRDGLGGAGARTPLRSVLVAGQLALSLPLVVAALLLARTLRNAYTIDPGFATERMLLVQTSPLPGTDDGRDPALVASEVRQRLAQLPGVAGATWGWATPLTGGGPRRGMDVIGYTPQAGEDMEFHINHVGPSYFETLELPLVRGRAIMETDRAGAEPVIVVNEAFVRRFWPGRSGLGERISMSGRDWTVVGVAKDVSYLSLTASALPYIWIPALQMARGALFHVRTVAEPRSVMSAVESAVREVAPNWVIGNMASMEDRIASALFAQRMAGFAVSAFGLFALLLAAVGLYGVIAFAVTQRTREVGVRIALGARSAGVLGLFLRQALPVVGVGIALGLAGAYGATRLLGGMLIGVGATDLVTFAASSILLCGVAILATWLPARRAARIDPMIALRNE